MGDDELGPEGFGTRGIPSAKRGYDKRVIDTLVAEAVERWAELKRRYDALETEVNKAGGMDHLTRDLKAVGEEVNKILATAREAADAMRERARQDAADIVAAAEARSAALHASGDEDALAARRDAWETGTHLLDLVREMSAAIVAEAEDDALLVRAEAERESHRRLAVTRKEQDDILRNARYELDRQVSSARDLAAEMLEAVHTDETSLGTAPDHDVRRLELLAEIERLRTTRSIDEVAVLPAEPPPVRRRDGSFDRDRDHDPDHDDFSDSVAAEVELMGETGPAAPPRGSAPVPASSGRRSARSDADDVGTLFEALRVTAEVEVVEREAPDPIGYHARVVIPAVNIGVRDLKRRIVDLQAAAIEALKTKGWSPDARSILAEITPSLEHAIQRAGNGGVDAARALAGVEVDAPSGSDRARRLMAMMSQELTSQLRTAVGGEGGADASATRLGKVFRSWRTDECERWVRAIVDAAYHDELLAALVEGGYREVRGVTEGHPCSDCPAATGAVWDPSGDPPDGTRIPPAHLGCGCTLAPG